MRQASEARNCGTLPDHPATAGFSPCHGYLVRPDSRISAYRAGRDGFCNRVTGARISAARRMECMALDGLQAVSNDGRSDRTGKNKPGITDGYLIETEFTAVSAQRRCSMQTSG